MPNASRFRRGALICLLPLTLVGCATEDAAPTLAGTRWQLTEIQSMDDSQGTTRTPDPSKFTVSFGDDGRATFQLDCNRGSGSFTATPSADDVSGALEFGPIATTTMMCPQPSLDQRVSESLSYVRGYLIEDRQLHMSLLADAAILTWERT